MAAAACVQRNVSGNRNGAAAYEKRINSMKCGIKQKRQALATAAAKKMAASSSVSAWRQHGEKQRHRRFIKRRSNRNSAWPEAQHGGERIVAWRRAMAKEK